MPQAAHLLDRAASLLDNPLVAALVSPRHIDEYLELVSPMLVQRETRARIVRVERQTSDTVTLVLAPSRRFAPFRAGQYVTFTVELDGRRVTRCFSLSCAPESGRVEVTIKARAGGLVSVWANAEAKVGDIVTLGAPLGDFVLPETLPRHFVFVAGGSGITPVAGLIESLIARGYLGQITCLVYTRTRAETIFGDRLEALAKANPNLHVHFAITRGSASQDGLTGRFTGSHLRLVAPAIEDAETFVCGPTPLIAAVSSFYAAEGLEERLHVERFSLDAPKTGDETTTHAITFTTSRVMTRGTSALPLLEQAENAGLFPEHGCRRGICHTCTCVLEQGSVKDLATGEIMSEPGQRIRICTSVPASDVRIAL